MSTQLITEREALNLSSSRVDRNAGVIRGVKILGHVSRNGRRYTAEALRTGVGLYEGAKVNVNHPKGKPTDPRDYGERLGSLRSVRATDTGLVADLHFNPKHALAEQLAWDAENSPQNVGMSHNVEARTSRQNGETVVESIVRVISVDLVADPATTNGLYESLGHESDDVDEFDTTRSLIEVLRDESSANSEFVSAILGDEFGEFDGTSALEHEQPDDADFLNGTMTEWLASGE